MHPIPREPRMRTIRHLLSHSTALAQQVALATVPHGGQRRARANAKQELQYAVGRRADGPAPHVLSAASGLLGSPGRDAYGG